MNHISFRLEADIGPVNHVLIDGQSLPFSEWLDWHEILDSLEQSGYWEILSCSCGQAACAGLDPVLVFCVDRVIAWHVRERGYTARFCFDARQMKQAVDEALQRLGWLHFLHCDESECHCPSTENTANILKHFREAHGSSVPKPSKRMQQVDTLTSKLLSAVCRGDLDAVAHWADAGADMNHVSVLESYEVCLHSVLQTALMFAPKAEVLPVITLLVNKGTDVHHAIRACPDFMHDILVMRDVDAWPYLAAQMQDMGSREELERQYLEDRGGIPSSPALHMDPENREREIQADYTRPKGEAL